MSNKIDVTKLETLNLMEFTAMLNAVLSTSDDIFDCVVAKRTKTTPKISHSTKLIRTSLLWVTGLWHLKPREEISQTLPAARGHD